MDLQFNDEGSSGLASYGSVPCRFEVRSRLRLECLPACLEDVQLDAPFIKDYDAIPGEGPLTWSDRWDTAPWGVLAAYGDGCRVGGAVVVWRIPDLAPDPSSAVLWDLRVHPQFRRRGVGAALVAAVARWARERRCDWLLVETQDINVAACRFYRAQGFEFVSARPDAYPECPDEAELIWRMRLSGP